MGIFNNEPSLSPWQGPSSNFLDAHNTKNQGYLATKDNRLEEIAAKGDEALVETAVLPNPTVSLIDMEGFWWDAQEGN